MNVMNNNTQGYVAFLLHAHLPFVRNTALEFCLEEKWLFEGLTESYLPLLMQWEALAAEEVPFQLTLSLSPPLLSMLTAPELPERYGRYLTLQKKLALKETERTANHPLFQAITHFYYERIARIEAAFISKYQGNLLLPLGNLARRGCLELITTCATHGYLPLMITEEARRAQIRTGIQIFRETIGWGPQGMWLPECGYLPGVEQLLQAEGIRYFIMSGHGFAAAIPPGGYSLYAPAQTGQVAVFARDHETSRQVWSRDEGYPGDHDYREFYRDIGYDLDYNYISPYLIAGRRGDTGFKYYRITGKTDQKEVYRPEIARLRIQEHARDFWENRRRQLGYWAERMEVKPIVTAPYDAELFGHWWFEGPDWLAEVLRLTAASDSPFQTVSFSQYLTEYPPRKQVVFAHSSWGEGGYSRYWLNSKNDWIYPHYHRAEKLMVQLAESITTPTPVEERALNQAGRELLLAQSSDWPFILTSRTVVQYAEERLHNHLTNFFKIIKELKNNRIDPAELLALEESDRIFPQIDYRIYQPVRSRFAEAFATVEPDKPLILMLSWEFPPQHVGGLGIHVRDLSIELVRLGYNVHVLTVAHDEAPCFTVIQGVGVHFIPMERNLEPHEDFISWMILLNMALADYGREWLARLKSPVILHAHDWLVAYAARELRESFTIPLVTTIHATEYGRNDGINTPLQQAIHQLETDLVHNSDQVICCSRYMQAEIRRLFGVSPEHLYVIANGVKPIILPEAPRSGYNILYVGRLVVEKGVQHLLMALPALIGIFPELKLVIAGNGPYQRELQELAVHLGIGDRVGFKGFVPEPVRDQLLADCRMTVFPSLYEPFGIVALEAMSAGRPVIVARTGGLTETVQHEENGLCFTPGDIKELQYCIFRILQYPEWAETMSRRAKNQVTEMYTWEAVARQTGAVYQTQLRHYLDSGEFFRCSIPYSILSTNASQEASIKLSDTPTVPQRF
jgi:1,4-alpha-glucan branching enzyme